MPVVWPGSWFGGYTCAFPGAQTHKIVEVQGWGFWQQVALADCCYDGPIPIHISTVETLKEVLSRAVENIHIKVSRNDH